MSDTALMSRLLEAAKLHVPFDGWSETTLQLAAQDAGIDPGLLELAGLVSIVAVVGLLVIVNSSLAALVGTGYAGLLTLVGVVSIPMPAVVLAGLVSVLATIGTRNGVFS